MGDAKPGYDSSGNSSGMSTPRVSLTHWVFLVGVKLVHTEKINKSIKERKSQI
jgi:hypothetical protein